jgi:tetraacyldisaccharide-1-P 4'-kinase
MTRVALLASQQPAEALTLGTRWSEAGDDVTVILLDGATAILRRDHIDAKLLASARDAGVTILAHDAAIRDHTITQDVPIDVVELDRVAALISDTATRVQWW